MYGKIFGQIYDGTLATKGPWQALVTFQQLIVLADKHGEVDMTPEAISRRTTIPLEIIKTGLTELAQPDDASRSPAEDGKRIVLIDESRPWGWRIVNYLHYRKIRSQEERRAYHREYMRKRRATPESCVNQNVNMSTPGDQCQPIAVSSMQYAVSKDQEHGQKADAPDGARPPCPIEEILKLYHETLPELPECRKITPGRRSAIQQRWREDLTDLDDWRMFFVDYVRPSAFLMGRSAPTNGRPVFRADIGWLTNPTNYAKIIEGKYHG